jgi:hypothetical protein
LPALTAANGSEGKVHTIGEGVSVNKVEGGWHGFLKGEVRRMNFGLMYRYGFLENNSNTLSRLPINSASKGKSNELMRLNIALKFILEAWMFLIRS